MKEEEKCPYLKWNSIKAMNICLLTNSLCDPINTMK